jgi:hypothetical protein
MSNKIKLSSASQKRKEKFLQVRYTKCIFFCIIVTAILLTSFIVPDGSPTRTFEPSALNQHWYRGNTHTHAEYSDKNDNNDIPMIAGWYRDAGYDFLVLSEHNDRVAEKKIICHDELSEPSKFIMICGLELSKSRHLTAIGIESYIGDESSVQDGVNKAIAAGGLPILNHPQAPVVTKSAFIAVKGLNHFEVFNGQRPQQTAATELLWDSILSDPNGRVVYGVASDDNHYKKSSVSRGWIMVESKELTKEAIVESIRQGKFYASTGVILTNYIVTGKSISIESQGGTLIEFIGRNGKILSTIKRSKATYKIKGDELYIRVKITDDNNKMAWTQPVFVN